MVGGIHLAVVSADAGSRRRNALLLGGLLVWMLYTRFFWPFRAVHATLPPCPFLLLTGHPCPFCGGTRSFAYMWQGDTGRALAIYPLGPLFFWATLVAIPVIAVAVLLGKDLQVRLDPLWRRAVIVAACLPLVLSWALKLTVLPN